MAKTTYKNVDAMPTYRLRDITNHPYVLGVDGVDYGPVKHELEQELYKRQALESERALKAFEQQQRDYFKHLATLHKAKRKVKP